jgi:hypothetical protein
MVHFGAQFKEIETDGCNIHFLRKSTHAGDGVLRHCSKRSWWWWWWWWWRWCEVATSSGFKQLLMNVAVELASCSDP